ncbi:uncharacterized protein LOC125680288 [Ostrea edulis]|uniref:uncharacterized protein LOC125680288 n=1 Tax=Ostrea edulis TaxID=37623 RepID=UPI0024AF89EE|nr:uncharacterized protein LOC125680288 [Ostrea edulis]
MSFLNELNHKLFTASLAGITALLGANTFMGYYHHKKIRESGFYKNSLELVRSYPPAVEHLGEPILGRRITYSDPSNTLTDTDVCVAIPLFGPKGEATMYTWSRRRSMQDEWIIDRLDLKIPSVGCWTFYTKDRQAGEE